MARHCGYCWTKGHNRRTCEQLTKDLQANYQSHLAARDKAEPGSERWHSLQKSVRHYAMGLERRLGKNPLTGQERAARRIVRKCSYCGGHKHNRRSCKSLIRDKVLFREATSIMRHDIKRRIDDLGVGVGTMFVVRAGYYNKDKTWNWGPRPFVIVDSLHEDYVYGATYFHFIGMPVNNMVASRNFAGQPITLTQLEKNKSALDEASEWDDERAETNIIREKYINPCGIFAVSDAWLTAEDHTIKWDNIDMFKRGKGRLWSFACLNDTTNTLGSLRSYGVNDILIQAALNLGYISESSEAK